MIRPYSSSIVDDHKDEWKIQLTMEISFISINDSSETHSIYMHSKNILILIGYETDDIIEQLFDSRLEEYQEGLDEKMEKSNYAFDSIGALYYKLHKRSLNRGGSNIDSPEWLKNTKATINPKNKKDDKCFQYAITVALNYKKINDNQQEICNMKSFIDKYDWSGIHFPSGKEDWNKFELNTKTIAVNVLFIPYNTKQIRQAYISEYNSDREKQVILLRITDNKKFYYLFVKKLSALLKGITSKHVGDSYCLNCLCSFRRKNVLKKHVNLCKDHDYCYVEMPDKDNNILKYNSSEKYMRVPFIMYVDLVCLLKNISTCRNDPNKSSTIKINKHIPCGYLLLTYCSFDNTKK